MEKLPYLRHLIEHFGTSHPRQRTFHCPHCAWGPHAQVCEIEKPCREVEGVLSDAHRFQSIIFLQHMWSYMVSQILQRGSPASTL